MDGRGRATAAQMAARRLKDSKGHRRRTSSPGHMFGQQNAQHGSVIFGSNPSDPSQQHPQQQSLPSFDLGQSQQNGVQLNGGGSSAQQTTSLFSNTNQQSGSLLFGGGQFSSSAFSFGAPQSVQHNPFSTASISQPAIGTSGFQGKMFSLPATSQPAPAPTPSVALFSQAATPSHPFTFAPAVSQSMRTPLVQTPQNAFSNAATPNNTFDFTSATSQPMQAQTQATKALDSIFSNASAPNQVFKFVSTSHPQTQPTQAPPTTLFSGMATPNNPFKFASVESQPAQAKPAQAIFSKEPASNNLFKFAPTSQLAQTQPAEAPQPFASEGVIPSSPFKFASASRLAQTQPGEAPQPFASEGVTPSSPFKFASATTRPTVASQSVFSQVGTSNHQLNFASAISQSANVNSPQPVSEATNPNNRPFKNLFAKDRSPKNSSQQFQGFSTMSQPKEAPQTVFFQASTQSPFSNSAFGQAANVTSQPQGTNHTSGLHSTAIAPAPFGQLTNNTSTPTQTTQDAANQSPAAPNIFSDQQSQNQSSSAPTHIFSLTGFKGTGWGSQSGQHNSDTGGSQPSTIFSNLKGTSNATLNTTSGEHSTTLLKSSTPLGEIPPPNSESEAPARSTVFANHFNKDVLHPDPITKVSSTNLFSSSGQGNGSVTGNQDANISPPTTSAQPLFGSSPVPSSSTESSKLKPNRKIAQPGKFFTGRPTISSPTKTGQTVDSMRPSNYSGIFSTTTSVASQQPRNFSADSSSKPAPVPESISNAPLTVASQATLASESNNRNSSSIISALVATAVDSSGQCDALGHLLGPVPNIPSHFSDIQKQEYATLYRLRSLNCAFAKEAASLDANPLADLSPWTHIYKDAREKILELDKKRKFIEDEFEDSRNNPKKRGKTEPFASGAVQRIGVGRRSQVDSQATTGDPASQGVKRKANEDGDGDSFANSDTGKRTRVGGVVDYPMPVPTEQRKETSQTVNLFSNILKQKDKEVIGNQIPEAKGASGAGVPKLSAPVQTMSSAPNLFQLKAPTDAASSTDPKLPTSEMPGDLSNLESKEDPSTSLSKFPASAQTTASAPNLHPSQSSATTPIAPSGLKLPKFGAPANFMGQFGKIAEENAKKEREKRKAEDFDSEDENEAEWERRDAEEQLAKKQKLAEQTKGKSAKFVPGEGFMFIEGKPTTSAPTLSAGLKPPNFGTPINFMGQFGKIAEENARKEKEKRKAEDFDSEDEGEAEWERRDAEEQRIKKQKLAEQIQGKSAKFVPGKGFSFVEEPIDSTSAEPTGVAGAKPPTFDTVSTPNSSGLGKFVEGGARIGETEHEISNAKEEGQHTDSSVAKGAESGAETVNSESGDQTTSSSKGSDSTVNKIVNRGGLFDRISKDKNGNPMRVLPTDGEMTTKSSTTSGINFGQPPFGQTWGTNSGSNIFGKSSTSVGEAASTPSNGTNMLRFKVTPDGDHTWKESSPIKFSTSKAPTFNFTETAPSVSTTFEGNNEKSQLKNLFGGDVPTDSLPPSPSPSLTLPKPAVGLFGSAPDSPAPSGSSGKSADVGFTFGGPPKSMASLLVPSMATSVNTSRATTPGVTTDTGESANESTAEGEGAEDSRQLNLTTRGPGEENEDVIFEVRAKVFQYNRESKQYKSNGVGPFRVLKHRETGKTRMLLRSDPNGNIVLNAALLKDIKYENKAAKFVSVVTALEDGQLISWQVKVGKNEDAIELARVLEDNKPQ
ncbi:hypothetical protein FGG08_003428 [Glutinoglossum americanum]|uniref:RanBD1 domain-containing protein n=1 Tax=Glutinoglossum americanum TaxID=1670608 RepID=A0A9P8L3M7_9PEZI|nr:hypothetical protein FGG08_003428 [Glutinoglossum americanum]